MQLLITCWLMPHPCSPSGISWDSGNSLSLYPGHDVLGCGVSLWPLWVTWLCSLPVSIVNLLIGKGETRKIISLIWINTTELKPKPSECYQHYFYSKPQTYPWNSCMGEINSIPNETRNVLFSILFSHPGVESFFPFPSQSQNKIMWILLDVRIFHFRFQLIFFQIFYVY